jgi:hypothetical protein
MACRIVARAGTVSSYLNPNSDRLSDLQRRSDLPPVFTKNPRGLAKEQIHLDEWRIHGLETASAILDGGASHRMGARPAGRRAAGGVSRFHRRALRILSLREGVVSEREGSSPRCFTFFCPPVLLHNGQFTAETFLFPTASLLYWVLLHSRQSLVPSSSADSSGRRDLWQANIKAQMCDTGIEIKAYPSQMPIVVCQF